ncbi:MAG: ATP-binding protein [Chitinispirillales bacterium]|jgi:hypothetical protein|nr:ATP-binding protein [Chitinispirillales bacterium]
MPKKLPYGISNFARIIEQNYVYVDKTRYIELLENENNPTQFLVRPRRFGKSLFLSVLENYYDLNRKDKFESLFGNLYIGKNPTPEQGGYLIMRFDFSGLDTDSREEFKESFWRRVQERVIDFLEGYRNILPNAERDIGRIVKEKPGVDALDVAFTSTRSAGVPIFVIIDEYDHFANNLIALGKTYKDEVQAGGTVRKFYEILKAETNSMLRRIFITGITPMMANDLTSGFNISTDYSLFPKYNEIFGFTMEEVEWIMAEAGIDRNLIKVDMEAYYNGYMFSERGKDKVYNSQMIFYLFDQVLQFGKQPDQIVDANLKTDYGRLRRLTETPGNREKLLEIMLNGSTTTYIVEKFSLEELNREEYFTSLLFYLGMLTVGGTTDFGETKLIIPNYSIKTLYWEYITSYIIDIPDDGESASMSKLTETVINLANGDMKPYLGYFAESILKRLSNRDLQRFDEKYVKAMMLATLFVNGLYLPVSEDENINGYTDIYLQKHPAKRNIKYEYVFEVKYVKTDATKEEIAVKFAEAEAQMEKYMKDARFAGRDDIKFAALVFKGKGDVEAREFN